MSERSTDITNMATTNTIFGRASSLWILELVSLYGNIISVTLQRDELPVDTLSAAQSGLVAGDQCHRSR